MLNKKRIRNETWNGVIFLLIGSIIALFGFGILDIYEDLKNESDSKELQQIKILRSIGLLLSIFGILFIFFGGIFIAYGYSSR